MMALIVRLFRPRSISAPPLLIAGGAAVAVGAYMPWMTYFAGLVPLRGIIGLNGRLLLAAGLLGIALGCAAAWGPPALQRLARTAAPTLGALIVAAAAWLLIGVRQLTRIHASNAMVSPRPAAGLLVILIGGAVLIVTVVFRNSIESTAPAVDAQDGVPLAPVEKSDFSPTFRFRA